MTLKISPLCRFDLTPISGGEYTGRMAEIDGPVARVTVDHPARFDSGAFDVVALTFNGDEVFSGEIATFDPRSGRMTLEQLAA